jgi:hypothetical protein
LRFPFEQNYEINGWRLGAEAVGVFGGVGGVGYLGYELGQ